MKKVEHNLLNKIMGGAVVGGGSTPNLPKSAPIDPVKVKNKTTTSDG
ncbi:MULTISPECIES: hypothetical protein [unclassified Pseudoalteromonas]|nr:MULTISPECIES: hypothetical protein [unclassified Pseudoalteromonas]MCG7564223.1 hypothetical protein [Pseudoalteromonas sp. McH1-42]